MSRHSFDPEIAELVGLNAAVIYQNISWWVEKNMANERHFYDEKYWTYNSIKAFEKLFPYLSGKQIRTALEKLVSANLIESGNHNPSPYDRTKWFCLSEKIHLPKKANQTAPDGKSIKGTVSKPVSKPVNVREAEDILSEVVGDVSASEFAEHRRQIRKPLTPLAATKISEAIKMHPDPAGVLNESIRNGWQGVFPDKFKAKMKAPAGYTDAGAFGLIPERT